MQKVDIELATGTPLKGMQGFVPNYQVYQREPIIVYICRNKDVPRIVPRQPSKVNMAKLRKHRPDSAPVGNNNVMADRPRRNSN